MEIGVIRHARYDYSLDDYQGRPGGPPATREGLDEVRGLARSLAGREWDAVCCGPNNRELETAQLMVAENDHKPQLVVDDDIRPMDVDYFGPDIIEHVKTAESRSRTGVKWVQGLLPSIEPHQDFIVRVARFLLRQASFNRRNILIVTHWETYAVLLALFDKLPFAEAVDVHDEFEYARLYTFRLDLGVGLWGLPLKSRREG